MEVPADSNVLVGIEGFEDAGVYKISDEIALVQTVDFFTPVVDDPYSFGQIAAANALSDIYAMGGRPLFALNIAGFPNTELPLEVLSEILRGGAEKAHEAGIAILGGHTVQDSEPKYGLVVTGVVDPKRIARNVGARVGDRLVLTKPLGFGTLTTAIKRELASEAEITEVVGWMKHLNQASGELGAEFGLHAATDITGFSLLGHALEMAKASGVGMNLHFDRIPFVTGARKYAEDWVFPGGAFDNMAYFQEQVRFSPSIDQPTRMLLFDPQTSGGLLLSVPEYDLEAFLRRAADLSQPAWAIGEVNEGGGIVVYET